MPGRWDQISLREPAAFTAGVRTVTILYRRISGTRCRSDWTNCRVPAGVQVRAGKIPALQLQDLGGCMEFSTSSRPSNELGLTLGDPP
jgi:hypothetical protein